MPEAIAAPASDQANDVAMMVRITESMPYESAQCAMQEWVARRAVHAERQLLDDELWLLEHPSVITTGVRTPPEDLPAMPSLPIVPSDRGGLATYHGPGQLIAYLLMDVRRAGLGPRALVCALEGAVLGLLDEFGIPGQRHCGRPGVYLGGAKIASLGLRLRNGLSYHGLALNVHVDLEPFARFHPCGVPGLVMTRLVDHCPGITMAAAGERLAHHIAAGLDRNMVLSSPWPASWQAAMQND